MSYSTTLKREIQLLRYERAVPKHHPPYDRSLFRTKPVPESRIRSLVDLPDETRLLAQGFYDDRVHDG